MANATYKFISFKWKRSGYNAFKASSGVMALLEDSAKRIAAAAESMSGKDYSTSVEKATRNPNVGSVAQVSTASDSAVRDNWKNNTLLKAVGSGRL